MHSAWTTIGLILLLLVSGCFGGSDSGPAATTPAPEGPQVFAEFTQDTGAIEGAVVDESILPVANATVNLTKASSQSEILDTATTDEEGRFAFSLLDPGAYRVATQARGFAKAFSLVTVEAGTATSVQVIVGAVASEEPYVDVQIWNGFIPCELAVLVTVFPCHAAVAGEPDNYHTFPVEDGWVGLVAETSWAQDADSLRMDVTSEGNISSTQWPWHLEHGPPPLRAEVLPGFQYPPGGPSALGLEDPPPVPDGAFALEIKMGYLGTFQNTINETAAPMCAIHPLGYCQGVGPAIEFRFAVYTSVFMFDKPDSLSAYTAVPDT